MCVRAEGMESSHLLIAAGISFGNPPPATLIRNKRPLKKDGWMIQIHLFRAASDPGYGARLNNFTIDDCVHRYPCEQQAVL